MESSRTKLTTVQTRVKTSSKSKQPQKQQPPPASKKVTNAKSVEADKKNHERWMQNITGKFGKIASANGDPGRAHTRTTNKYEWTHILTKDHVVTQSAYAAALAAKGLTEKPCGYLVALDVTGYDLTYNSDGTDIVVRPNPKDTQVIQVTSATVECHADNYPLKVSVSVPVLENLTGHQTAKAVGTEHKQLFATSAPNNTGVLSFGHLLDSKHHRSVISLPVGEEEHKARNELRYMILGVYSVKASAIGMSTEPEAGVLTGRITCRNLEFPPITPDAGFVKVTQPKLLIIPTRSPQIVEGTIGLGSVDPIQMPPGYRVEMKVSVRDDKYHVWLPEEGLVTRPRPDVIYALEVPIAVNSSKTRDGVAQEEIMTYMKVCLIPPFSNQPKAYLFQTLAKAKAADIHAGYLTSAVKDYGSANKLVPLLSMGSHFYRENHADGFEYNINRATMGKKSHSYTAKNSTVASGDLAAFPKPDVPYNKVYTVETIVEANRLLSVPEIKEVPKE